MKITFIGIILFTGLLSIHTQVFYMETGKMFSNFYYKNSDADQLDGLRGVNWGNLCAGFRTLPGKSKFQFSLGASYNRYGSKGSNPTLGNYYEWDVTYLGIDAGIDYEFLRPPINYNTQHGFSFYPKISLATEFLVSGTQNLNSQITSLRKAEEFDRPLYFIRGGLGVNYYISKTFIVFAEYLGGTSILIGDYKGREQLQLRTHNMSIGISINLNNINQ